MINAIHDDTNYHEYDEECLQEVMNQRCDKLFGSQWPKSKITKDYWHWKRKPEHSWDNPELDEPHIFEWIMIVIFRYLVFDIHKGVSIAFID